MPSAADFLDTPDKPSAEAFLGGAKAPPKKEPSQAPFQGLPNLVAGTVKAYEPERERIVSRASDNLKHDVTDPTKGVLGLTKRVAGTFLDAADYVTNPITAGLNVTGGRVAEKLTGGRMDRDTGGALLGLAWPVSDMLSASKTARAGVTSLSKAFHPAAVDDNARAAASIHRQNLGKFGLMADKETYQLSKNAKVFNRMDETQRRAFIDYVENRSTRKAPPDAPAAATMDVSSRLNSRMARASSAATKPLLDTGMQKAADAIANLSDRYRARIEYVLGKDDRRTFVKDYYAHLWKQKPAEVEERMAAALGGKQGSGRNLRKRNVPTISEGLERGLELRYDNPVDAMVAYNENMAKFLRTHAIKDEMVKAGQANWFYPGKQPTGWVELQGALTKRQPKFGPRTGEAGEATQAPGASPKRLTGPGGSLEAGKPGSTTLAAKPGPGTDLARTHAADWLLEEPGSATQIEDAASKARRIGDKAPGKTKPVRAERDVPPIYQQLYAPEGAARVYNNHVDQGLSGHPLYQGARSVVNSLVQLRLGLSTFHASTEANEATTSAVSRAFEAASKGKVGAAAGALASAPTSFITTPLRGRRMFKEIVGDVPAEKIPEMNSRLNSLYEKSGGRLNMDRIYSARGAGSLFQSMQRGTFTSDLASAVKRTYTGSAWERAKGVVDLAGNVIQTTAAPLFEAYVPALKRGAWAQRMEGFIKANPGATEAELEKAGQGFLDSVDNRFGELMVDNNFWSKAGYQMAQLALLSPSWNLGTVREIGGGVANIPKSLKGIAAGKGMDPKTAYVAALLSTNAVMNGAATYMKTGQMPEGMDWFAYRTGATNQDGSPEREALPGYMKDILALVLGDPKQEVINKLNPGLKEAWELYNNKDYRGLPIYPDKGAKAQPGDKGLGSYLLEENMPISVQGLTQGRKAGSNLSPVERALSIRPSPRYVQEHDKNARQQKGFAQRDWNKKRRADRKATNRLEKNQPPAAAKFLDAPSAEQFLQ